ncbi:hypothetical protein HDU98_005613, partial [Podochytrium sp. JEL0797]
EKGFLKTKLRRTRKCVGTEVHEKQYALNTLLSEDVMQWQLVSQAEKESIAAKQSLDLVLKRVREAIVEPVSKQMYS